MKIKETMLLIEKTDQQIKNLQKFNLLSPEEKEEIAEKVGFADPHYFGISFKKMTGCTPTEYAREKRK